MTLKEQIIEISNSWINPEFTRAISFPRVVDSLCIKFFEELMKRGNNFSNFNQWEILDMKAVYVAKRALDRGDFSEDLLAVK